MNEYVLTKVGSVNSDMIYLLRLEKMNNFSTKLELYHVTTPVAVINHELGYTHRRLAYIKVRVA